MIHFFVSFGYVAMGAAGAILLPQLVGWLRVDIAIIGGIAVVLTAANIHFFIVQSERIRRLHKESEWIRRRTSVLETDAGTLAKSIGAATRARHEDATESERRISQVVDEVRELQGLLERFVRDRAPKPKSEPKIEAEKARSPTTIAPPIRTTLASRSPKYSEPEEFPLTERKR